MDWEQERIKEVKNIIIGKLKGEWTFSEVLDNKEKAIEFIKELSNFDSYYFFKMLSSRLRDDKEVVMIAVKKDGSALEVASDRLKDNFEVVMTAVKNCGYALDFASDRLKDNEEIVSNSLDEGSNIIYASERIRNDRNFIIESAKNIVNRTDLSIFLSTENIKESLKYNIDVLKILAPKFKFFSSERDLETKDMNILYELAKINGYVLSYIDKNLLDKKLLKLAFVQNGLSIRCLSEAEKEKWVDKEIGITAINSSWKALRYLPEKLKDDRDIITLAIQQTGEALKFASDRLKNDLEIVDEASKSYPKILEVCKEVKSRLIFSGLKDRGKGYLGVLELLFKEIESYGEEVENRCCLNDNTSWIETKKKYVEHYTKKRLNSNQLWDYITQLTTKLSEALKEI